MKSIWLQEKFVGGEFLGEKYMVSRKIVSGEFLGEKYMVSRKVCGWRVSG